MSSIARGSAAVLFVTVLAAPVRSQVTTQEGASILIFPSVVVDEGSDTFIQIVNGSLLLRSARCFYVNGQLTSPDLPPGPLNPPLCTREEFGIDLGAQQPTHWVASRGREVDPLDEQCRGIGGEVRDCDGAGLDPGRVPALPSGFRGHLICVQVDASGAPIGGNALRGQATITDLGSGDLRRYNAVGLPGLQSNDGDDALCLGDGTEAGALCPRGAEYGACPSNWTLPHPSDGSGDGTAAHTSLSVVPCLFDLSVPEITSAVFSLEVVNELEQRFSVSRTVGCNGVVPLAETIFSEDVLGTEFAQTRLRPQSVSGGFVLTAEIARATEEPEPLTASTAVDLHPGEPRQGQEVVLLPPMEEGQ